MTIRKTATNKLSIKLSYWNYLIFCGWVREVQKSLNVETDYNISDEYLEILTHFTIINKLLNRLSKTLYYPFKLDPLVKKEITVTVEMEEALVLYKHLPGLSTDPVVGFLNREIHKIIIN